jgi:UPF0716 protein FxsA
MNMAKWVLWALLAMPILELAAFIAVAATIGFGWALSLIFAGSVAGLLILRHAGGAHIARIRVALGQGTFTAFQADSKGGVTLLAGILLVIPGFISDVVALLLLVGPLRRRIGDLFGGTASKGQQEDGVVDLAPEQWHRIPTPSLPKQRRDEHEQ